MRVLFAIRNKRSASKVSRTERRSVRTIDRRVVHRSRDSEVFLVACTPTAGMAMRADVAIPPDHARARARRGALSPSITLEVFRQGAFLIAHQSLGIPLEWHFVTKYAALKWVQSPPLVPRSNELRCELDVRVNIDELKQGQPFLMTWVLQLLHEGRIVAVGELRGWALAPHRYRALRRAVQVIPGSRLPTPPPSPEGAPVVQWNDGDAFLFSRPGDHVVSMVLIDAVFELAASAGERDLVALAMDFRRFAERSEPIHYSVTHGIGGAERVQFTQSGEVIAEARTSSVRTGPCAR